MIEVTANYDESWKEALNEYFESFLSFFFPRIHELIDWTESPQPLDKELQEITASSETESRIADKLYKVWLLDKQRLTKEQIVKLFKIIDTMMTLPQQLQAGLVTKVNRLEEERKMPLISPTEQLAMERGEKIGEQKVIIRQLNRRIGEIKPPIIKQIRELSVEHLEELAEALLDFSTVANLEQWLQNRPKPVE